MGVHLIRIGAVVLGLAAVTACKSTDGDDVAKEKKSKGGLFGWGKKKSKDGNGRKAQKKIAANGLGDPSWPADVNKTIDDARGQLPGFDPRSAPRRNPDVYVPVDPNRARSLTYSRAKVGGPYVAMTFDDGPHPVNTPRLLDLLKRRNIRATFFVVGTNAKRYPAIMKRMVAEGHEVANHTVNHPHLTKISHEKAVAEVRGCEQAIVNACGVKPRLFRPPGGFVNDRIKIWLKDKFNYSTVMWAVDPQDWRRPGSSVVASRIINSTDPGEIILAHDIHAPTIAAMPAALDGLLAKGFRFVTVSQLISMERAPIAADRAVAPANATVMPAKPLLAVDGDSDTADAGTADVLGE